MEGVGSENVRRIVVEEVYLRLSFLFHRLFDLDHETVPISGCDRKGSRKDALNQTRRPPKGLDLVEIRQFHYSRLIRKGKPVKDLRGTLFNINLNRGKSSFSRCNRDLVFGGSGKGPQFLIKLLKQNLIMKRWTIGRDQKDNN